MCYLRVDEYDTCNYANVNAAPPCGPLDVGSWARQRWGMSEFPAGGELSVSRWPDGGGRAVGRCGASHPTGRCHVG